MQYFRNLRLALRLAIAFGALAVGLLLVALVGVQRDARPEGQDRRARSQRPARDADRRGARRAQRRDRSSTSCSTCSSTTATSKRQDELADRMSHLSRRRTARKAMSSPACSRAPPSTDELRKFADARAKFRTTLAGGRRGAPASETINDDAERRASRELYESALIADRRRGRHRRRRTPELDRQHRRGLDQGRRGQLGRRRARLSRSSRSSRSPSPRRWRARHPLGRAPGGRARPAPALAQRTLPRRPRRRVSSWSATAT